MMGSDGGDTSVHSIAMAFGILITAFHYSQEGREGDHCSTCTKMF